MSKRFIFDKVVCDETNNTKEDIDNGVVNADIYGVVVDKIEITLKFNEENKLPNHQTQKSL